LIWSQTLLLAVSNRVVLITSETRLQRRAGDVIESSSASLAFNDTRTEIAESTLYSILAVDYIESSVVVLQLVKNVVLILGGWPKTIRAENKVAELSACICTRLRLYAESSVMSENTGLPTGAKESATSAWRTPLPAFSMWLKAVQWFVGSDTTLDESTTRQSSS
jgi:hypothetical protein